jgi:hypothetical protein
MVHLVLIDARKEREKVASEMDVIMGSSHYLMITGRLTFTCLAAVAARLVICVERILRM